MLKRASKKGDENKLRILERKFLRKYCGLSDEQGSWKIGYSAELYQQHDERNITAVLKAGRLILMRSVCRETRRHFCRDLTSSGQGVTEDIGGRAESGWV
jgi:hypothetical protein